MAEVVDEQFIQDTDSWKAIYRIRRADGEEVVVDASCTGTAQATAEATGNTEALAAMADRGRAASLKYAEKAQPPSRRGRVMIRIWFDPSDGGAVRHDYDYEREPP